MKNFNKIIVLPLLLLSFTAIDVKAEIKKVAQTGYQFLKVDASARAAAMGGAYTLVGVGASSMFYNPAGLAEQNSSLDVFSTQTMWIADISYLSFGISKSISKVGVFGLSARTANYGDVIGTRVASNSAGFEETGNIELGAMSVGLAYARKLTDRFWVGGQVNFVSQNLGETLMSTGLQENKTQGLSYDFGTMYYPGLESFRFGMSIRNFSQEFKYEDNTFQLPLTFTIGAALDVTDIMKTIGEDHDLLITFDAVHPRDYTERINVGSEYGFRDMIFLRAGYKFNHDTEGVSGGIGINIPIVGLKTRWSYSMNDAGDFSPTNRFSVSASF